jgi:polysaccharide export outer membrane protein
VWKNPELSMEVIVRMDGKISLPLLDDVQAEGLTPMELKEFLTREFSEYVTAPDVTVIVTQMNSQFVLLMGDGIRRNTQVQLTRDMRVLDAIAVGGGFSSFADRDNVRIVRRQDDGTEVEYRFDYDAYIKGRAPGTNIVLKNRDTIIVPD